MSIKIYKNDDNARCCINDKKKDNVIKLSDIRVGQTAKIVLINESIKLKRRLYELGIYSGERIKLLSISPLKNSFLIEIKNYTLALRRDIADSIVMENYE